MDSEVVVVTRELNWWFLFVSTVVRTGKFQVCDRGLGLYIVEQSLRDVCNDVSKYIHNPFRKRIPPKRGPAHVKIDSDLLFIMKRYTWYGKNYLHLKINTIKKTTLVL
jgi:hypothetical protein